MLSIGLESRDNRIFRTAFKFNLNFMYNEVLTTSEIVNF